MAQTLRDCGGGRAGRWEHDVPLQQLCLASSLQMAFTTQHFVPERIILSFCQGTRAPPLLQHRAPAAAEAMLSINK